jgi:hypothetical protein
MLASRVTFVPQLRGTDERARRPLGAQEAGEDEHDLAKGMVA